MGLYLDVCMYSRGLECLRELVLQLALVVDGEDPHDGNAHSLVRAHVLMVQIIIIKKIT